MDDETVLNFLRNKKRTDPAFWESIKALERETTESGMSALGHLHARDEKYATLHNAVYIEPSGYLAEFERFCRWVDGSIDAYRYELSRILYPVFVKSYLQLVEIDAKTQASELLERYRPRFTETAGDPCVRRTQEMKELEGITSSKHLRESKGKRMLDASYAVAMSDFSYELLFSFLQGARLTAVLGVINRHVPVARVRRPPLQLVDDPDVDAPVGEVGAELAAAAAATNTCSVKLGRVAECWEDRLDALQQRLHDQWEAKQKAYEQAKKTNPEAQAPKKPHAVPVFRGERVMKPGEAVESVLARVSLAWEGEVLKSMRSRARADAESLPSCCFFTFVNTAHSLTSATVTQDALWLGGGFEDSSVRLYDLKEKPAPLTDAARNAGVKAPRGTSIMRGHAGPVYGVDFSPDGALLASASGDGTVRLWSTELKCGVVTYEQHTHPVWDVRFAPFGFFFATASADSTALLWSTDRKYPVRAFVGHQSDVDCIAWHPSCSQLLTGSSDHSVRMWDINSGQCTRILSGIRDAVTCLAVSPDGMYATAGCHDGSIKVWDIRQAQLLASMEAHKGAVWTVSYSQGAGALLCSGSADCTVRVWQNPAIGPPKTQQGERAGGKSDTKFLLKTWQTKSTHVYHLGFSWSNLLLGAGALTLRPN